MRSFHAFLYFPTEGVKTEILQLRGLHSRSCLILTTALWQWYYCSHFPGKKIEVHESCIGEVKLGYRAIKTSPENSVAISFLLAHTQRDPSGTAFLQGWLGDARCFHLRAVLPETHVSVATHSHCGRARQGWRKAAALNCLGLEWHTHQSAPVSWPELVSHRAPG